jgi:hypothetical protein
LDKISSVRYYTIVKGSGAGVTAATLQLSYNVDDGVTDATNLRIAKDDGLGSWEDIGGVGTAATSGTITSNNFTTFTDQVVLANAAGGSNPLPVEMASFTASSVGNSAVLRWSTATEMNSTRFDVERRAEGSSLWILAGSVNAAGTSNALKEYSFEDRNLVPGVYVFRLKQIENDGTFNYSASAEVSLMGTNNAPHVLEIKPNFPNPFNPSTTIKFCVPADGYAILKVYNILGQEVETLFNGMAVAGQYIQKTFDGSRLTSGVYFSRLRFNGKNLMQRMLMTK